MRTTGEPQDLASLYKKMAAVMASLQRIPKRGYNSHFKYEYVTDSDVMDAVRLAMGAAGLGFFNNLIDMEQDSKRTQVTVDATFADGDTGATMTVTWVGEALDTQDKGINKALTGAVKYGLLKTFLISTGEDDPDSDGDPKAKTAKAKSNGGKPKTAMHEAMADAIAPHWIADDKVRVRFWAWATGDQENSLGLTNDQVHEALNVEHVADFPGTMGQAKELIEAWVKAATELVIEVPA